MVVGVATALCLGTGSVASATSVPLQVTTTTTDGEDPTSATTSSTAPAEEPVEEEEPTPTTQATPTTSSPAVDDDRTDQGRDVDADEEAAASAGSTRANPLLVPGPSDGRVQAAATQADPDADSGTSEPAADTDAEDTDGEDVADEDEAEAKVRTVMLALVGVAVLLTLLTIFYWWYTRPGRTTGPGRGAGDEGRRRRGARGEAPNDEDADDTVGPWQTDSTSTR